MAFGLQAENSAPRRHRFLCCDYQGNKVAIIASDGSIEWEFAAQTPQKEQGQSSPQEKAEQNSRGMAEGGNELHPERDH